MVDGSEHSGFGENAADTSRRTFLKGATTALLAAGAFGTSVTSSAAATADGCQTTTQRIDSWDGTELATRLYVPAGEDDGP